MYLNLIFMNKYIAGLLQCPFYGPKLARKKYREIDLVEINHSSEIHMSVIWNNITPKQVCNRETLFSLTVS